MTIDARGLVERLRSYLYDPGVTCSTGIVNFKDEIAHAANLIEGLIRDKEAQSATIARLNAEVERMRGAMNECLPYLEEGYMDDEEDDEPIGWMSDHDGTNQRPVALTFGAIRRFRAALAPKEG